MQFLQKLDRSFFDQHSCIVAEQLLGKILVFGDYRGIITETEAYRGSDDPASHAFKGKTLRTKIMFGPPAFSYVYLVYGMYHCLNIVTESDGNPAAVLIRGLKLFTPEEKIINGPGKLCKHLGISLTHNNLDLMLQENFYIAKSSSIVQSDEVVTSELENMTNTRREKSNRITQLKSCNYAPKFNTTARIGIKTGLDKMWRFIVESDDVDTMGKRAQTISYLRK